MSGPSDPSHFPPRATLWFLADLVEDPLVEIPKQRRVDALLSLVQAAALESVACSLGDIKNAISELAYEVRSLRPTKGAFGEPKT